MNAENDSRTDTINHINRVATLLQDVRDHLAQRARVHDASKLEEPEKSAFDRLKALSLSGMDYGSPEYRACLKKEKPAIEHHYAANSHHPEFYPNGIEGMSLLDVLEMLIDWKAATERMKDGGDINKSLEINRDRFTIGPQLCSILANTIRELGWSNDKGQRMTPPETPPQPETQQASFAAPCGSAAAPECEWLCYPDWHECRNPATHRSRRTMLLTCDHHADIGEKYEPHDKLPPNDRAEPQPEKL